MKRKPIPALLLTAVLFLLLAGCGGASGASAPAETQAPAPAETQAPASAAAEAPAAPEAPAVNAAGLSDGTYLAKFDTDSSMFHLNEASEGRGVLTVENGEMTIHIVMPSKNIVNLFFGSAEDAAKAGAAVIEPTVDSVTYKDGMTEEVYGFDVPVPWLDETFSCAIIGTHGNWYDHAVSVKDPVPAE